MNQCIKCGGQMIGDGNTIVEHCEDADDKDYWDVEPDGGPIFCKFQEVNMATAKKTTVKAKAPTPVKAAVKPAPAKKAAKRK